MNSKLKKLTKLCSEPTTNEKKYKKLFEMACERLENADCYFSADEWQKRIVAEYVKKVSKGEIK